MKELTGRTIARAWIAEHKQTIAFETDAGVIRYDTYGDCCAECWIEHIANLDALIGATVTAVEEKPWNELPSQPNDYGVEEACFVTISTPKGMCDIETRLSHNGYYGGSIDLSKNDTLDGLAVLADDF